MNGPQEIQPEGWLASKCSLFEDFHDKSGVRRTIASALCSHVNPPEKRLKQLAEVAKLKCVEQQASSEEAKRAAHKDVQKSKERLPAFIYQGTFDGEAKDDSNFVQANGVFGLDFDGFDGEAEAKAFRELLFEQECIGAAWLSASRSGVHALALGPVTETADEYRDAWIALTDSITPGLDGHRPDPARKNRNGILYGSHDVDLRWRAGPVAFAVPANAKGEGSGSSREQSTNGERGASFDQLKAQLEHIPNPDLPYDEWRNVVFAAKHECGEMGREAARAWSATSSKHDRKDFDRAWDSATRTGGSLVTWGTLVAMATDGYNAKGGRPRKADPKPDTLRTRAQAASASAEEHGWDSVIVWPAEQRDAMRILKYTPERLLKVKGTDGDRVLVLGRGGLWSELEHRRTDRTTGAVAVTCRMAREKALEDAKRQGATEPVLDDIAEWWGVGDRAKDKSGLAQQLAQRVTGGEAVLKGVHEERLNDRREHPVIPLEHDQGAWHLTEGRVVPPEELAACLHTDMGWVMPMPRDCSETDGGKAMNAELDGRYDGLWQRTAAIITTIGKNVDIFVCARSGFGKTTFYDALQGAFPGGVERLDARTAFNRSTMRFTPTASGLTRRLLVILDECGHVEDELPAAVINSHTDEHLTIEEKGQPVTTLRRTGSLVLVGHQFPKINVHSQGIESRIKWVLRVPDDAIELSQETRDLMLSRDGVMQLQWRILEWVKDNAAHGPLTASITVRSEHDRVAFIQKSCDPKVNALREDFEKNELGFVTNEDVKETLDGFCEDNKDLPGTAVTKLIAIAFGTEPKRGRTAKGRGWHGIKRKVGTEATGDVFDEFGETPF